MKNKTKHIIIIILSVIVWFTLFFIPTYGDLLLNSIILVIQLSLIFFGWYKSFRILEKINAANKLLDLIIELKINNELNQYKGICHMIAFTKEDEFVKYLKYEQLLRPTEKERLKWNSPAWNKLYWFAEDDWETRIKYLKSYL